MIRSLSLMLAVVWTATSAFAQDHSKEEAEMETFRLLMQQEAKDLSVKHPKDSDIIDLVERILMVRLSQTLGLTVEQTQELGNRVGDCRSQVYDLKWLRADMRQSLRESIEAKDEIAIEQKLDKLLKLEITIAQLIEKMIQDSTSDLTIEQAAKFYLFIEEFENDLSRTVDKAREIAGQKDAVTPHTQPAPQPGAKQE